jgi:cyclopropane-fatty-acyl-phospholipid synthase
VANYPSYFRFLQSKLRIGGLLLNHCITRPGNTRPAGAGHFIDRYVFPDGELTGSGRIISAAQDVGLEVVHEENLRRHYAMTLRDWCANLVDNWVAAVDEVGLATAKVWGLYMAGSRLGFETNNVQLHQVLAVKVGRDGDDGGLPLRPWWST